MISVSSYIVIIILNYSKFSITAMCLIVPTDIIITYDIINYIIEIFNWII